MSYKTNPELLWLKTPKSEIPLLSDNDLDAEKFAYVTKKSDSKDLILNHSPKFWLLCLAALIVGSFLGMATVKHLYPGSGGLEEFKLLASNETLLSLRTKHHLLMSSVITRHGDSE